MMKWTVLTLALLGAITSLGAQVPILRDSVRYTTASVLGLSTQSTYGAELGTHIDAAVNNIHARIPGALITHLDVLTVMCMESGTLLGKQSQITSSVGARGVTQVMPGTLADYARSHAGGFYLPNRPDLLYRDPRFSIEAGALIFNHHLMNYKGDRRKAAIAYNGGPGRAHYSIGQLPKETREYAYVKLPACWNTIKSGRSPFTSSVWTAMLGKVSELTGGTMRLADQGTPSSIESIGWAPAADPVSGVSNSWRDTAWGQWVTGGYQNSTQGSQTPTATYPAYTPTSYAPATSTNAYQQYVDQASQNKYSLWSLWNTSTTTGTTAGTAPYVMPTASTSLDMHEPDSATTGGAFGAVLYDGSHIKWGTIGAATCTVAGTSVDASKNFSASGITGEKYVGYLTDTIEVALVCNTESGTIMKYKKTIDPNTI